MKMLHQTFIKDSNNFISQNEIKVPEKEKNNRLENVIEEENEISNKDNNTLENLQKNINNSNIFENISEISKNDINFIGRGVKTKIFETENSQKICPKEKENEFFEMKINQEIIPLNRLEKNIFMKNKQKDVNENLKKEENEENSKIYFEKFVSQT